MANVAPSATVEDAGKLAFLPCLQPPTIDIPIIPNVNLVADLFASQLPFIPKEDLVQELLDDSNRVIIGVTDTNRVVAGAIYHQYSDYDFIEIIAFAVASDEELSRVVAGTRMVNHLKDHAVGQDRPGHLVAFPNEEGSIINGVFLKEGFEKESVSETMEKKEIFRKVKPDHPRGPTSMIYKINREDPAMARGKATVVVAGGNDDGREIDVAAVDNELIRYGPETLHDAMRTRWRDDLWNNITVLYPVEIIHGFIRGMIWSFDNSPQPWSLREQMDLMFIDEKVEHEIYEDDATFIADIKKLFRNWRTRRGAGHTAVFQKFAETIEVFFYFEMMKGIKVLEKADPMFRRDKKSNN